jgi:hypothetical protein
LYQKPKWSQFRSHFRALFPILWEIGIILH